MENEVEGNCSYQLFHTILKMCGIIISIFENRTKSNWKLFVCNIIIDKLSFSLHTSALINCETFIPKHFQCMISYALFIERIIFTLHMLKDPQCFASKHTYTICHSVVKCGYYDLSNNFYGKTHIWRYSFTSSF